MSTRTWLISCAIAFGLGVFAAVWWGRSEDWQRWDREQRQPLLEQIRELRPRVQAQQLRNAALLAQLHSARRARPPITTPPARPPRNDTPLPQNDAGALAWRTATLEARSALATEREARDRAERNWAIFAERARVAEARLDSVTVELAATDSLVTEQAAQLRLAETVLEDAPRPRRAWVTVSGEALAILGGGRILAAEAAIGPGKWQVIGRAESASYTGERLAIGIRRSLRVL
jgi:hypothetical protein